MASSDDGRLSFLWIAFSAVSMVASGALLYLSQRTIPIGTAYIVWTGIGGVGTVVASLASLITMAEYNSCLPGNTGRFLAVFSAYNLAFLAVLTALTLLLP